MFLSGPHWEHGLLALSGVKIALGFLPLLAVHTEKGTAITSEGCNEEDTKLICRIYSPHENSSPALNCIILYYFIFCFEHMPMLSSRLTLIFGSVHNIF